MAITLQPFLLPGEQFQQSDGRIIDVVQPIPLQPGYAPGGQNMSFGTYMIAYEFPNGIQGPQHEHPGVPYTGTKRRAFIPATEHGRRVLRKFLRAWDARLLFTVGTSLTTGRPNSVIWNGIPHKTNVMGGPEQHGFPDPNYLTTVEAALAESGIE
jgi:deltex-like protein